MNFKTLEVLNTNKLMKFVIDEIQKFDVELLKSIL